MVVSAKWTGTDDDRKDMKRLQLEQVLRRNFGRTAMFGFASTLICSWEAILVTLGLSLVNGGTAGLFWTYIVCVIGFIPVYLSVAELSSAIPTSGGQYYWVAILAPRRYQRFLSYITAWLCTTAWETGITSSSFLSGTLIQALFILNIADYNPHPWHGTLLAAVVVTVAIFFNTFLARKLPLVEGLLVILHILGIAIVIPLWVLAPRRTGGSVLVEFYNPNGWMSDGVATMVTILYPVIALLGFDCSVHMVEETKDSSRTVPVSMLVGFGVNALLGFFVMITCIYTVGPLDTALVSPTGYTFVDMFYKATNSRAATTVMTAVIILNFTASVIAVVATSSRQLWAFARSKGVPFSNILAPGALRHDLPIAALAVSFVITLLLALINLGSSTALTAIFSVGIGSLLTSYLITIGCAILRRLQGQSLPEGRFSLGKWGLPINIVSIIFLLPSLVFTFFPPTPKPTKENMNWGIAMYGGVIIFASIYYVIWARHTYISPKPTYNDEKFSEDASPESKHVTGVYVSADPDKE